jgi:Tfp pilus assembly protein PilV
MKNKFTYLPRSLLIGKTSKGQSLIEVVVAIAVVIIVILALVAITTVSIRNANFSRNQALATKYAQEGIEKVRALRDQNAWQTFTSGCESPPGLTPLPSPFVRSIDCHLTGSSSNCVATDNTCEATVTVSWTDAQGTHKSELTTRLTNWK